MSKIHEIWFYSWNGIWVNVLAIETEHYSTNSKTKISISSNMNVCIGYARLSNSRV
jgi:hypothetical protein